MLTNKFYKASIGLVMVAVLSGCGPTYILPQVKEDFVDSRYYKKAWVRGAEEPAAYQDEMVKYLSEIMTEGRLLFGKFEKPEYGEEGKKGILIVTVRVISAELADYQSAWYGDSVKRTIKAEVKFSDSSGELLGSIDVEGSVDAERSYSFAIRDAAVKIYSYAVEKFSN